MTVKCFIGTFSKPKAPQPEPADTAKQAAEHILRNTFGAKVDRDIRNVHVVAESMAHAAARLQDNAQQGERLKCIHLVGDAI